jgi:hypothetical protein
MEIFIMDITVRNKNNWSGEGIYVGRGSPLGNPYKLTNEEDRSIVIERYGAMLKRAIQKRDPHIISALHNIEAYLQEHGKCNLICYCSPKPCHADIIKQVLINKFRVNYWLVNEKCPTCGHGEAKIGGL